jgi:Arc/MetJ-type ribon-helix-helix transcriptional regulator
VPRFSVTFDEEDDAYLAELAGEDGEYNSKAGAVRAVVREDREGTGDEPEAIRQEYDEKLADLKAAKNKRIEELEQEIDRLNRERRQLLEQREENQELVKFAEEQRSFVSEQRDRQNAPVWRRAKWWVFGGGREQGRSQ